MIEELIENGQYLEALELLDDISDEHNRYYRLVCLNALERYDEAKELGKIAKEMAEETYYEVVALYLNVLKELKEYEEAIDILVEELSMPYIPNNYDIAFNNVYDEILLLKQEASDASMKNQVLTTEEIAQLIETTDSEDVLYYAIDQLSQLNVRRIMPTIRHFLSDRVNHGIAKSLLIEILIDQQIDDELEVYKFNHYYDVNPSYLPLVLEQASYAGIYRHLERVLESENPTLLNICLEFLEYMLYTYYPEEIYEDEYNLYAASIHYYIASLQSIEVDHDDLEGDYNVEMDEVEEKILALQGVEC